MQLSPWARSQTQNVLCEAFVLTLRLPVGQAVQVCSVPSRENDPGAHGIHAVDSPSTKYVFCPQHVNVVGDVHFFVCVGSVQFPFPHIKHEVAEWELNVPLSHF